MRIYLGSDHGGYQFKELVQKHLKSNDQYEVVDLGTFSEDPVDYPDLAREVAEKVLENHGAKGILICGTGIGMSIAANKLQGIRAALCTTEYMAEMARRHNDANIVCFGQRVLEPNVALSIVDKFLTTEFSSDEERHVRRVQKIEPTDS